MNPYRVQSLAVKDVWGHKEFAVSFRPDVTILIGANGTGKTTILNLLRSVLEADIRSLLSYDFSEAIIKLTAFSGGSTKTIRVSPTEAGLAFHVSRQEFMLPIVDQRAMMSGRGRLRPRRLHPRYEKERQELEHALRDLVPFVWLPVSRRLPVSEDDQERLYRSRRHLPNLESVDERLRDLGRELAAYRLRLESRVSQRYKEFERRVLEAILYSEKFDSIGALRSEEPPNQEDQRELMGVFSEVGLSSRTIRKRIRAHFLRAEAAHQSLQAASEGAGVHLEDLVIIPLIRRTRSLVSWARTLGAERDEIFSPIRRYEDNVNQFLRDKAVTVEDDGKLTSSCP